MPARQAQLPDDTVERGGRALRAANLVFLASRIPEQLEWPAFGTVRQQAAQGEPYLDDIDARASRARHRRTQDVDREPDDHTLMARQVGHGSTEVARLDPHDLLRVHARGVRRPIAVTRSRAPAGVATIG
jgi:hypothetical protein